MHLKRRDAAKASVIQNGFQKNRSSQGIIDQWCQLMDRDNIGLSADIKEVYKNSDSRFNISHLKVLLSVCDQGGDNEGLQTNLKITSKNNEFPNYFEP